MDNHTIDIDKMHLVANVCLLLANKLEETTTRQMRISEINEMIDNAYNVNDYKALEVMVLKFFNWYVNFPTAATYSHYFMQMVLSKCEMRFLMESLNETTSGVVFELHSKMKIYLDKIIDGKMRKQKLLFFYNISFVDVHFMQMFKPSKLAACVISAARLRMGLIEWTDELAEFTGFTTFDLKDCLTALLR